MAITTRKRILVTGGAGFLGSHLCERLLADDSDVLCVDNYFTGRKDNIVHLLDQPRFEVMRHDITFPLYVEMDEIYNPADSQGIWHISDRVLDKITEVGVPKVRGPSRGDRLAVLVALYPSPRPPSGDGHPSRSIATHLRPSASRRRSDGGRPQRCRWARGAAVDGPGLAAWQVSTRGHGGCSGHGRRATPGGSLEAPSPRQDAGCNRWVARSSPASGRCPP